MHHHGEKEGGEVSNHTEVDFCLHGLLDQLVALFFETLLVAVLASVDTATEVVVLRRRRG
jgi:hypothetical protein